MCLLIAGPSNKIRAALLNTEGLLADIYKSNADGLGAMYTTPKLKLRTPKVLPKTLTECIAFIRQLPDDERNLALHWRMRTHGDTNLENCHPYPVIEGKIALMHNGILSQGNSADRTKSDTWHYIADVVRPMLVEYPKLFTNPAWLNLVEDDITRGNRFAIMDNEGSLVILNKNTGISHDGMWFSNTYAWDPELLIPGYAKTKKGASMWTRPGVGGNEEDTYETWYGKGSFVGAPVLAGPIGVLPRPIATTDDDEELVAGPLDITEDEVWEAMHSCDHHMVKELLLESPLLVLHILMRDCEFVPAPPDPTDNTAGYSEKDEKIVKALVDQTYMPLVEIIRSDDMSALLVSQVICWYGDWVGKPKDDKPNVSMDPESEIIAVLAKECPDLIKGLDGRQVMEIGAQEPEPVKLLPRDVGRDVMAVTRDSVRAEGSARLMAQQTEEDLRARAAELELEVAMLTGELDQAQDALDEETDEDVISDLQVDVDALNDAINAAESELSELQAQLAKFDEPALATA